MRSLLHLRVLLMLTALADMGGLLRAQTPSAQQPPPPTFRAGVEAVQITAIVTDEDGNLVTGLTAADFEVLENGQPRAITTFSAIELPLDAPPRAAPLSDVLDNEASPGRTYLIALDGMSADNALRTRHFLREFLEKHFTARDTAAVVLTTRGLRDSGQDFTRDVNLLLKAIDRFDGGDADMGGPVIRQRNVLPSLRALTESLAKMPGRKALVFVTHGLSSGTPEDSCDCNPVDLIGYTPGPLGGMFSRIDRDFHHAISAATRGNVAIYPIDPAGLTTELPAAGSFDTSRMDRTMATRALAEVTGGFSLTNSNSYAEAFERLAREQSVYYLLGFEAGEQRRDGRYVDLEVRVRRPRLRVRALDGYVAPQGRPDRPRTSGNVLAAVLEAVRSPVASSGVPIRVFAAPFRTRGRDATVAVTVEIAAARLNLVEQDGLHRGEMEIMFAVTDATGKRHPIMRHRAALALKPETYERVREGALRILSELPLPKGRYQIRVSAGGAAVAGSVVYDVTVPDFSKDLAMSGIALTSARARNTFTATPHRQLLAPLTDAPTTQREFRQDDTLTIFGEVYENRRKPHRVDVTVALHDSSGAVVGSHTLHRENQSPREAGRYPFAQNLVLEDVAPGQYTIRVQASSSLDDRARLLREIPITVR